MNLLNSSGVEYLIVGGFAVALYGHPRTTGDLDIWIGTSQNNVDRVRQVLHQFGFPPEAVMAAPLHLQDRIIRMGNPPLRIELLTSISGASFDDCFRRRVSQIIDNIEIGLISREDLLANKRAAGRPQDLADLDQLG